MLKKYIEIGKQAIIGRR